MNAQQFRKRDDEPQGLQDLRLGLFNQIMPGLQNFSTEDWNTARQTANQALSQQSQLLGQIPTTLNRSNSIVDEMATLARTGNLPSGLANNMNASVNQELKSNMGTMLNNLASRGVVNSSIMSQGVDNLSKQVADAYSKNYLSAYQAALNGMNSALQGTHNNTNALLSATNAIGNIPSQAYEGVSAQIMPAFNLWKAWQSSYDNREDYDTVVDTSSGSSSCITGDTKVRIWDKRSEYGFYDIPASELTPAYSLAAWDFYKGKPTLELLTAFFKRNGNKEYPVIRVAFEDGSNVGVVKEHLFFDLTEGKFVAVNKDSQDFIGHDFANVDAEGKVIPVKVKYIYPDGTVTETYAPQTGQLNFLAEGFITANDGQLGLCKQDQITAIDKRLNALRDRDETDTPEYKALEADKTRLQKEITDSYTADRQTIDSIGRTSLTTNSMNGNGQSASIGTLMIGNANSGKVSKNGYFGHDRGDHRHAGTDYPAKEGTPINILSRMGDNFTVVESRKSDSYGNTVVLETVRNGTKVRYRIAHMQDNSVRVKKGDTIKAGDVIGHVGSTGKSTGPHMHLEIAVYGKDGWQKVDPERFLSGEPQVTNMEFLPPVDPKYLQNQPPLGQSQTTPTQPASGDVTSPIVSNDRTPSTTRTTPAATNTTAWRNESGDVMTADEIMHGLKEAEAVGFRGGIKTSEDFYAELRRRGYKPETEWQGTNPTPLTSPDVPFLAQTPNVSGDLGGLPRTISSDLTQNIARTPTGIVSSDTRSPEMPQASIQETADTQKALAGLNDQFAFIDFSKDYPYLESEDVWPQYNDPINDPYYSPIPNIDQPQRLPRIFRAWGRYNRSPFGNFA